MSGVILRRDTKRNLLKKPPIQGELIFSTNTGEHGWLNEDNQLVWAKLDSGTASGQKSTKLKILLENDTSAIEVNVSLPDDTYIYVDGVLQNDNYTISSTNAASIITFNHVLPKNTIINTL